MKRKITLLLLIVMVLCSLMGCGKKKTYTVNYDTDGGSFIEAFVIDEDHPKAIRPADPVKEGYVFKEWQLNGAAYDFSKPVTSNIILKAVWESGTPGEEIYYCTVIIGSEKKSVQWKASETLVLDDPVPPANQSFAGWKVDGVLSALTAAKNGSVIEAVFADSVIPCTSVKTDYTGYYTVEGYGTWKLDVYLTPANTTDKLSFKSDDENVVVVDNNGNITAKNPGKTKIHITCGSATWTIDFETRPKKVEVTSITITPSALSLYLNNFGSVKATVAPDNATDKTITYSSSDPSIAMVDKNSGQIMGYQPGNVTIYATSSNGLKANCAVCIEGETVVFTMADKSNVKAESGQKVPYTATHIACYDGTVTKQDVTNYVTLNTDYPSALSLDGKGNVVASGPVYSSCDAKVWFTYSDGSSFNVVSQPFTVHIEK